jgi:nucleoid DNA-binding protein
MKCLTMNKMNLITTVAKEVDPTQKNSTKAVNVVFRTIAVERAKGEKSNNLASVYLKFESVQNARVAFSNG